VLAPEKTALVIEDRFAGANLCAAAFSFDHRIDKAFKFFTPPAINAEPMRKAIRSAVFPAQILHLSRYVGIAPIIKGKQAAMNASVVTIPLCQNEHIYKPVDVTLVCTNRIHPVQQLADLA
jgi:hypothetical protein